VHESVDVPEPPVIDVEDSIQDRLVELVVAARVTIPANPFIEPTVIVEVPDEPALTLTLPEAAVTVKSWIVMVTVAV
jgi:hypothetical protein